mmetsp:Transcript_41537/g.115515  ORF Transcript_41537/g.115515 Transcript_41537/m.115515 type:complete len:425 (-) Transcript_41537:69-1343(-)
MGKKNRPTQKQWRPRQKPAAADPSGTTDSGAAGPAPPAAPVAGRIDGSFIPPGCDADADEGEGNAPTRCYEDSLVRGFWCPPRLRGRNESLIEAVNDWHYAMLNDTHRNEFYWDAMEGQVQGKRVVDIGAGSGLLSLMAAKQGASEVLAIEASRDMVDLAQLNIQRNGETGKIRVIHSLSNNVVLQEEEKADVIVSETLGALMLGEGMLDYLADARRRLARPGAAVIPAGGAQYAMLVASPSLAMVSSVQPQCCKGFDLSAIGSLQDTGNLFFTKQWGFRLNSLSDLVEMSQRICILEVDFQSSERQHIPATKTFQLQALQAGVVHAVVASWEVWSGSEHAHRITTHPEDTKNAPWGFARDMQWGQGMQLVEDFDAASKSDRTATPGPFTVKAGEPLLLTVRFSVPCRQTFQFTLRRGSTISPK